MNKLPIPWTYIIYLFGTFCIRFVFVQGKAFSDFFYSTSTYASVLHTFFIRSHTLAKTLWFDAVV